MNKYMNEQVISIAQQNTVLKKGGGWVTFSVDLPNFCLPTWWERNEELVTGLCSGLGLLPREMLHFLSSNAWALGH